ncbi:MAG: hypothetical protein ACXAC2_05135 [Candidatus Kariarchaeaceae archaeon]|jgi:hypothetical protein
MTPGNILHRIKEKVLTTNQLKYEEIYENFFEKYLTPRDLKFVVFKKIFLLLDKRPHSLISISYALFFAKLTDSEIYVITQGLHDSIVADEAKEEGIHLTIHSLKTMDLNIVLDRIYNTQPDLVILNYTHSLRNQIQNIIRCPILTVKASHFEK